MSIYKIEKMPNTNNGYTWLVSLWVIFIFLKLLSFFYIFFFFFHEQKMLLKSERKKWIFKYEIKLI